MSKLILCEWHRVNFTGKWWIAVEAVLILNILKVLQYFIRFDYGVIKRRKSQQKPVAKQTNGGLMALRQRSFRKTFLIMSIYINPHIKCPPKITGRIMIELILGLIRLNTCLPGKMHTWGCVLRVCLHAFMGIKLHKSDRGRRKSSLNLLASMKFNFSNQFLQAIVVWSFTELFTLNLSHWFSVCQKCKTTDKL